MPKKADTPTPDVPDAAPPAASINADVADLGYEQARDELVEIVARLESGRVGLEESMTLWQRGEALADRCEEWLDEAQSRLQAVTDSPAD